MLGWAPSSTETTLTYVNNNCGTRDAFIVHTHPRALYCVLSPLVSRNLKPLRIPAEHVVMRGVPLRLQSWSERKELSVTISDMTHPFGTVLVEDRTMSDVSRACRLLAHTNLTS